MTMMPTMSRLMTCRQNSDHADKAIEAYITGKDAFVESDLDGAQSGFEAFREKLNEIGEHGLSGDGHMAWMESWSVLMENADTITQERMISKRHVPHSGHLSDELIKAVHLFGVEGVVYHQYCPMAFDDEGANWLSTEEQIQNPYLPETMLMCGEVIERIEHPFLHFYY
jgi:membrane fusion protein, copper/silver efflux system